MVRAKYSSRFVSPREAARLRYAAERRMRGGKSPMLRETHFTKFGREVPVYTSRYGRGVSIRRSEVKAFKEDLARRRKAGRKNPRHRNNMFGGRRNSFMGW
jgi:hypothetical protein